MIKRPPGLWALKRYVVKGAVCLHEKDQPRDLGGAFSKYSQHDSESRRPQDRGVFLVACEPLKFQIVRLDHGQAVGASTVTT